RLRHRDVRVETSNDNEKSGPTLRLRLVDLQRRNEIHLVAEETEVLRQHADHRDRLLIQSEHFTDDVGIAVEMTLPKPIRDHDDRSPVIHLIFLIRVQASKGRFDSKRPEYRRRESVTRNAF